MLHPLDKYCASHVDVGWIKLRMMDTSYETSSLQTYRPRTMFHVSYTLLLKLIGVVVQVAIHLSYWEENVTHP